MRSSLPLLAVAGGALALQTGSCDYSKYNAYSSDSYCINETVRLSTEFEFKPLFPKGARFVYSLDSLTGDEWYNAEPVRTKESTAGTESTMIGWYLEYDDISFNNSDLLYGTQMMVFFTNVSKSTGGGNNGCDDLIGSGCVDKITQVIKDYFFSKNTKYYGSALNELTVEYPVDPDEPKGAERVGDACPAGMIETSMGMAVRRDTINFASTFANPFVANEAPPKASVFDGFHLDDAMPSGNWSLTYARELLGNRTFEKQLNSGAVAVLFRRPELGETNGKTRNYTESDLQFSFVCAKASQDVIDSYSTANDSSSDGGDDKSGNAGKGSDDGGAASMAGVPGTFVLAAAMGVAFWISGF